MSCIPQGPILWILYYNDIIVGLEYEVLVFADHICIFAKGNKPDITTHIINRDLERISLWATKWKVNLNPSKTDHMIFSNKVFVDIPNVNFNQTIVKQVLEHKHLGIWLTPSLCFSKQFHDVCLRAM